VAGGLPQWTAVELIAFEEDMSKVPLRRKLLEAESEQPCLVGFS